MHALAVVKVGVTTAAENVKLLGRVSVLVDWDRVLVGRGQPVVLGYDDVDRDMHFFDGQDRGRHRVHRGQHRHTPDAWILGRRHDGSAGARSVAKDAVVAVIDETVER